MSRERYALIENAKKNLRRKKVNQVPSFHNALIRRVNRKLPLINDKLSNPYLNLNASNIENNKNDKNKESDDCKYNHIDMKTFYHINKSLTKDRLINYQTPYQKIKLKQKMQKDIVQNLQRQQSNHTLPISLKAILIHRVHKENKTNKENSKNIIPFQYNNQSLNDSYNINAESNNNNGHYTCFKGEKHITKRTISTAQINSKLSQYQSNQINKRFANNDSNSNNATIIAASLTLFKNNKNDCTISSLICHSNHNNNDKSTAISPKFISKISNKPYSTCHSYKFLHENNQYQCLISNQ